MQLKTLHDTSLLATVSACVWSARKLDKKATHKLTQEASADANAARVNKYLMASADTQLAAIRALGRKARDILNNRSLPWDDMGYRLVANVDSFTLIGELADIEDQFKLAVDAFCESYPELREKSLAALGDMAEPDDYPDTDTVRTKFSLTSRLMPLPVGFSDSRTGLTAEQQKLLEEHYTEAAADQFTAALTSAWERLRDNIERYVDRLALQDGKAKVFQSSMVDSLRDTMELLTNLNVFNTPALIDMRATIENQICHFSPDTLRTSYSAAQTAHNASQSVVEQLNRLLATG